MCGSAEGPTPQQLASFWLWRTYVAKLLASGAKIEGKFIIWPVRGGRMIKVDS